MVLKSKAKIFTIPVLGGNWFNRVVFALYHKVKTRLPKFYDWGGGGVPVWWTFGWETGRDNDLICVKYKVTTPIEGEIALSPSCRNRLSALLAFVLKAILISIDGNLKELEG